MGDLRPGTAARKYSRSEPAYVATLSFLLNNVQPQKISPERNKIKKDTGSKKEHYSRGGIWKILVIIGRARSFCQNSADSGDF